MFARISSTSNDDGVLLIKRLSKKTANVTGPFAAFMRYYSAGEPIAFVVFASRDTEQRIEMEIHLKEEFETILGRV